MVEEEDLLDKLEDVDHPVCQQATDALLTAESEADQVPVRYDSPPNRKQIMYGMIRLTAESEADQVPVWYITTHRRIGSRSGMVRYDTSPNRKQIRYRFGTTRRRIGSRSDKDKKKF